MADRSAATHHSASDTNVYEGRSAHGRVTHTLSRGRLVWADGMLQQAQCAPGSGRYVPMAPFSPWLFSGLDARDAAAAAVRRPVARTGDDAAATAAARKARMAGHEEL
jgi:dihydropyrimidinase